MLREIRNSKLESPARGIFWLFCLAFIFSTGIFGQSRDQGSPTPITLNQINGEVKARDIGDSRLTTYYYIFDSKRGDIFINIITRNLNGDIDVFTVDGLKPRTKVTVYADTSENETGRVIYMRKPGRLLLRIQGRSPNDDSATYQIKFAGSFAPMDAVASDDSNELPKIDSENEGTVRVNSVGTIIETPAAKKSDSDDKTAKRVDESDSKTEPNAVDTDRKGNDKKDAEVSSSNKSKKDEVETQPRVIVEDPFKDLKSDEDSQRKNITVEIKDKPKQPSAIVTIERAPDESDKAEKEIDPKAEARKKKAALKKIRLVIRLKNGEKFEKRMSKVSSFNVFDGVLKVVGIDGKVTKFSILDVDKITIQ